MGEIFGDYPKLDYKLRRWYKNTLRFGGEFPGAGVRFMVLWAFIKAVTTHWRRELIGGALMGLLAIFSACTGIAVPPRTYGIFAGLLIFYAMFLAWRDAHVSYLGAQTEIARLNLGPKALVSIDCSSAKVSLHVTNEGAMAEFHVLFTIEGAVHGNGLPPELAARWVHTIEPKTKIAKGQTCHILLADLENRDQVLTWQIYAVLGQPISIRAVQSSLESGKTSSKALNIVLSGNVIAVPDLINGIQPFKVVLEAFGARAD